MKKYIESEKSKALTTLNYYRIREKHRCRYELFIKRLKRRVKAFVLFIIYLFHANKYGVTKIFIALVSIFNDKTIIDYDLDYRNNFCLQSSVLNKYGEKKIAVYTSIFGKYDSLLEPLYVSENCDYFVITDADVPEKSAWKKIDMHDTYFDKLDDYHKSKYCKIFPDRLFPNYDVSIWVDGNVMIVGDLMPLVFELKESSTMASFQHPNHDCIYTESNQLLLLNIVKTSELKKQLKDYLQEGFPKHFGMREFSIIVRKHNDNILISLMNEWWEQLNKYTMRDQLSFPYILWKNGKKIDYIQMYEGDWRENPRFLYVDHVWRHHS